MGLDFGASVLFMMTIRVEFEKSVDSVFLGSVACLLRMSSLRHLFPALINSFRILAVPCWVQHLLWVAAAL